jgi:hypothetical protein
VGRNGRALVPRIVVLSPRFLKRARALGVRSGSALSRDLGATVRALASAAKLPLPGDVRAMIPPTLQAFVRRVPRRNLWVWYLATDATLTAIHLANAPPVPLDD